MLVVLIFGILFISVLWPHKKLVVIGFCILFLVLGVWRHERAELRVMNSELKKQNDYETTFVLLAIVMTEPDIRDNHTKLTLSNIKFIEDVPQPIDGKILVTTDKYPEYKYGDKLKIIGKLETPAEFDEFNYKDYLAKDGIYSVIYYPKIELAGQGFGKPIYKILFSFKNKFK
ncbi:MAG: ComEC/Rec2 family competence protein, partial [bacterium]|nr:ComEC/Rec2 family competence protein [bacterium]